MENYLYVDDGFYDNEDPKDYQRIVEAEERKGNVIVIPFSPED